MSRTKDLLYYQMMFDSMTELPQYTKEVDDRIRYIIKHRETYEMGVEDTNVPWYFVAIIHSMESDCNFKCQIANGERWTHVTKLEPEGLGPWKSWIDSTQDIIRRDIHVIKQWTIPGMLKFFEAYNGMGYYNRGLHSPYLWSKSNHPCKGKYIEYFVDGKRKVKFDSTIQSDQIGAAVLLRRILNDEYPRVLSEVPDM